MNANAEESPPLRPGRVSDSLAELLGPGIVSLGPSGSLRFADERALELLGCAQSSELETCWGELSARLERAGLSWADGCGQAELDLPLSAGPATAGNGLPASPRRVGFDFRPDRANGGVVLVRDLGALAGLEADLRLASQMRSLAQISPAVAHDLRAPINAMVFAIEILRETFASGRAADPANRDKLLHRVGVLNDELQRLHRGLETFLAYISPRSDREEVFDLRELAEELAALLVAPARKQQVQVQAELPPGPWPAEGNRYQLRQAFLHVGLAALSGVPRRGSLHLALERQDSRARVSVYGVAGEDSPPEPESAAGLGPEFDLRLAATGAEAQLWAARSILAAHGGEARAATAGEAAGAPRAYEVELTLLGSPPVGEGVR